MTNRNYKKIAQIAVFALLTVAILCFIFSNSAQSRSESAARSSAIMEYLKPLLDPHGRVPEDVFHNAVRKAAHFAEFAALGFCCMGLSDGFAWKKRRRLRCILPLLAGVLIAAADEIIQIFAVNRGPGFLDVLLDSAGVVFGVAVFHVLLCLIRRCRAAVD